MTRLRQPNPCLSMSWWNMVHELAVVDLAVGTTHYATRDTTVPVRASIRHRVNGGGGISTDFLFWPVDEQDSLVLLQEHVHRDPAIIRGSVLRGESAVLECSRRSSPSRTWDAVRVTEPGE